MTISSKQKFKKAKLRSRIKDSAHGEAAVDAAENDDFVTIAKHNLLRKKSIKLMVRPIFEKNLYDEVKEGFDHVEVKTAEQLEKERIKREADEARERRRIELEELERQRLIRLEKEERERANRLIREEIERVEREQLERIRQEEYDRMMEEEKLQQQREEAARIRAELEQARKDKDEREKRERREAYEAKIQAVLTASSQKDREKALKEVGKLTIADFGNQEEWERHQREVGKLNILEIAGQFKKAGKKKRKERRKTQSINWSNAKNMISKFQAITLQEDVIRFVKPTAVNLAELNTDEDDGSPYSPFMGSDTSAGSATPDSGIDLRQQLSQELGDSD